MSCCRQTSRRPGIRLRADVAAAWGRYAAAAVARADPGVRDRLLIAAQCERHAADLYRAAIPHLTEGPDRATAAAFLESLVGPSFAGLKSVVADEHVRSPLAGGNQSKADEDLPAQPGLLVGFRAQLFEYDGRPAIKCLTPIFLTADGRTDGRRRGQPAVGPELVVEAEDGYAVAGLTVDAAKRVHGLRVRFMRVRGTTLDPRDAYDAPWLGASPSPSRAKPATMGGDGNPVIGLFAYGMMDLDCIGLVQGRAQR